MSQMLKSSGAMGIATLSSRILGMVREVLYARFMADGPLAGAFKMAFMIPNLFRRLLGEGALTAAFIPIFKEKEKNEGEAEMWRAANAVISGLLVASSAIIALVVIGLSLALYFDRVPMNLGVATLYVKGGKFREDTRFMLELARIMFPYLLSICLAAIFMGMLNARGKFFVPAMGATVLNVILIATVLWIAPRFGATLREHLAALAVGVLVAGAAQAVYQLPFLRQEGFSYRWVSPWHDPTVREVVRKMVPGMMGVAAFQLNVVITQSMAFAIDSQIVASFDYAVRLMELPQGVFGISLATYLLPTLSGLAAEKRFPEFRASLRQGLGYLLFANLLASVLLVVLAKPIVRLIYEHGKFDALATERVSFALACLAPGLVAFSVVNILARAFYALGDVQTPMRISAFCLAVNVVFAWFLIGALAQGGLGIANTMSAAINVGLLGFALRKKLKTLDLAELPPLFWKMLAAAAAGGLVAWFVHLGGDRLWGHATIWAKASNVFAPMGCAALVYFAILLAAKAPAAVDYASIIRQKIKKEAE